MEGEDARKAAINVSVGPGFLLFLVFLTLKLCGKIGWSWFWVVAPLWAPAGLFLAFFALVILVTVIGAALQ